jgi:PIN domain nuclease of toxin-antitoxin system
LPIDARPPTVSDKHFVLDASALLAVMLGESGADAVHAVLDRAKIGAVNLSEVVAKLQERGVPDDAIDQSLADLDLTIVPLDQDQAMRAGKLRLATRGAGLSLGDRACLAVADALGAVAITTDQAWAKLSLDIEIAFARS